MKIKITPKKIAFLFLLASLLFFGMGFIYPLLRTGYQIGPFTLKKEYIYLGTSFNYFINNNEIFIGIILLLFTIIFPAVKYVFLFATLSGVKFSRHQYISIILEIINKWAMLDVFVVAVLILNMKFDSTIIISRMEKGTTFFAISVILMMIAGFITGKIIRQGQHR